MIASFGNVLGFNAAVRIRVTFAGLTQDVPMVGALHSSRRLTRGVLAVRLAFRGTAFVAGTRGLFTGRVRTTIRGLGVMIARAITRRVMRGRRDDGVFGRTKVMEFLV